MENPLRWTLDILDFCRQKIDVFVSEDDKGIYDAMNKGILASTGDILGILNSDDFYADQNILTQVADVFEKSKCDCLYGDLVYVNRGDSSKIVECIGSQGDFNSKNLDKRLDITCPTFLLEERYMKSMDYINWIWNSAADYEMILRLLYNNLKNIYLNKILVKMRVGGMSTETYLID